MKDAHSISTRRAYGVQRVCRVWHRARSSVYARRQATIGAAPDNQVVQLTPLTLVQHGLQVLVHHRPAQNGGFFLRYQESHRHQL